MSDVGFGDAGLALGLGAMLADCTAEVGGEASACNNTEDGRDIAFWASVARELTRGESGPDTRGTAC